MPSATEYIERNRERFLGELVTLLRFPSVSTDPSHVEDVRNCAEWLRDGLAMLTPTRLELIPTAGHPIIYAAWETAQNAPTVLIYGHYDVQPADPLELWETPPFEPSIRNGCIYARGATDNKGQFFAHLKALEALLNSDNRLPLNVKLLLEGEEEIGSMNLRPFLEEHREMLKCDTVLISDTALYQDDLPTLCYGLRGLCYLEVTVRSTATDLHSGVFGGVVDNPILALAHILSGLRDGYGRVTIPGFYDDVVEPTSEERQRLAALPSDVDTTRRELGAPLLFGEVGYSLLERRWLRPTLDVNGIVGGFIGSGAKTVLPAVASAKLSMRLVPNQRVEDIAAKAEAAIRALAPPTVNVEVHHLHGANPVVIPIESLPIQVAARALERTFGRPPVFVREGGTIPVVEWCAELLRVPIVLMGLGLESEGAHAPNEHFHLKNFFRGIQASVEFLREYAYAASSS
ncbi:MAG: dipeptidase [Candidatus Kapabacteria bacterium]|nr:dipeptidase [Candidatus Kapabacteria bacterium]MDW8224798.1 dipeptidase [Bacteroidota bacterium]